MSKSGVKISSDPFFDLGVLESGPGGAQPRTGGGGGLPSWPSSLDPNLVLRIESYDFDAYSDTQTITQWNDKSGNANHMLSNGASYDPWASQTVLLNGHASVRFTNSTVPRHLRHTTGWTGDPASWVEAEILAIMIVDNDPASGDLGSPFKFGSSSTNDSHVPLNDGDVYENFCDAGRKNSGNPTTSFTSWLGYNVRGIKTPYNRKIIVGSEVLENTGTGTWTEPKSGTACAVGISYQGLYTPPTYPHRAMDGNLAAIYLWSSVLGSTPRGDLVTYINDLWGVTIPST